MSFTFVLVVAVFLSTIPFLIHKYKWYWLISGYSTMSKEKRERINWAGFSLFMRNAFFVCSLIMLAGYWLFDAFELKHYSPFFFFALIVGTALIIIIFGQTRFKSKNGSIPDQLPVPKAVSQINLVITLSATALFIAAISFFGMQEPKVEILGNNVKVNGMYGFEADITKITVDTISILPDISMRTNGFEFLGVLKGHFRTRSGENIKLFVRKRSTPYIKIIGENLPPVYLNFKSPEKTYEIFNLIKSKSQ